MSSTATPNASAPQFLEQGFANSCISRFDGTKITLPLLVVLSPKLANSSCVLQEEALDVLETHTHPGAVIAVPRIPESVELLFATNR